jgi:hypothetical protein
MNQKKVALMDWSFFGNWSGNHRSAPPPRFPSFRDYPLTPRDPFLLGVNKSIQNA